jgi:hypothetical protein
VVEQPPRGGGDVMIARTCYCTCVHLAILRICDTRALDVSDRDALTAWSTYYLWILSRSVCTIRVKFALCLYGTRCVVSYVRIGPQEMTSCDVMTGQYCMTREARSLEEHLYLNCRNVALRPQSQLGLQSKNCLLLSSCESSLRLVNRLVLVRNK